MKCVAHAGFHGCLTPKTTEHVLLSCVEMPPHKAVFHPHGTEGETKQPVGGAGTVVT